MIDELGKLFEDPKVSFGDWYLGNIISKGYQVTLLLAGFLAFFWLFWGAFEYILAGGDKEKLSKAKARITWAIIGFIFIILAYFITQFAAFIFPPKEGVPF